VSLFYNLTVNPTLLQRNYKSLRLQNTTFKTRFKVIWHSNMQIDKIASRLTQKNLAIQA
jgi:hypothetical protein